MQPVFKTLHGTKTGAKGVLAWHHPTEPRLGYAELEEMLKPDKLFKIFR